MIIFILFPIFSLGQDIQQFRDCSTKFYTCGEATTYISYPFWGNERPSYCGLQGFRLTCREDNITTVQIMNTTFRVIRIDQNNSKVSLALDDLQGDEPACSLRQTDSINTTTFQYTLFSYVPNGSLILGLYFSCEEDVVRSIPTRKILNCSADEGDRGSFFENTPIPVRNRCERVIGVPVSMDAFDAFNRRETMSLEELLWQGFEMEYRVDGGGICSRCQSTGGTCGSYFNSSGPSCMCSDGYSRLVCNSDKTYEVDCDTNSSQFSSFAIFHPEILEKKNYSIDLCDSFVHVPVHTDSMNVLLYENYTDVLRKGFLLEWQCSNCDKYGSSKWKMKLVVGLISGVCGICLMGGFCLCWRRRNSKKRYYGSSYMSRNISSYPSSITDPEKNGTYHGVQVFKYKELEKATNYFDSKKELGDGGFGTVYHGKLKDGREVAVKRLYENNYKRVEQFMNEVGILAHLRHRNLVSLYGCTTHHSRELLLVYEYIPNGTVADHLHGEKSSPGSLPWSTRINIATETASALVYLHASDVIHRDVKTNNILLDNSFSVKVADFGLSRLFPTDVTHVSTAPQGTPGYVDPEYHECYQLTSKSDVYSFGVVLIELISSKPAVDITRHRQEINLSNMALNKIRNDALGELVDPSLGFETDYEVRKMISAVAELAFRCLSNERDNRPPMKEVLENLISFQNGEGYNKEKEGHVFDDDSLSLKDHSQTMSPDSVAIAWSTSTISTSGG
ncbi:hypothetical protein LXL04_020194 [Taraxacum kok-saghyz]